jgi:hypothetical protein
MAAPADAAARLTHLRQETAALEAELGIAPDTSSSGAAASGKSLATRGAKGGAWWRTLVAGICLVVLAVAAPLAVVATWAHDQVSDTNRYLDTVAPLAHDPSVQAAVSARISEELLAQLDIEAVTKKATNALVSRRGLPPRVATSLRALGTPLANAIESFVTDPVERIVSSPQFADAWTEMNRVAHEQMVVVLTGETSKAVAVEGDAVRLDLGPVIDEVKARLADSGFALADRVPDFEAQFTMFESSDLTKAQTAFRVLSALATGLPVLAVLLLAVAVFVSRRHRRTLVVGSLVVAASMLLLGLALNAFRVVYLDAVPSDQLPADAAGAIYDQVVSFIRFSLRAVLVMFLAVAVVAWVSGPGDRPVAVRRATTRALDTVRHRSDSAGLNTGPVGAFLGRYRGPIRGVVVGVVVLAYVLADHPTGAWVLKLLLGGAVLLLLVELLARQVPVADEDPATAPSRES